jgi:uncharacterized protein
MVDGKARALLAMLFGASTLLVIDRAEMDGRDGVAAQRRRLLWLLPIGFAHYALLWSGDILILLAVGGLVVLRFAGHEPLDLVKGAFLCFAAQLLIMIAFAVLTYWGTSADAYHGLLQREMVLEIGIHRDGYGAIAMQRIMDFPFAMAMIAVHALPETLGFMLLGMAMAKGGFFFSQWTPEQYRRTARHAYLVGVPPMLALGLWAMASHDPRTVEMIGYAAAFPFRIPLTIAHAALLMLAAQLLADAWMIRSLAAVGRLALTNYLLCSLAMTSLAYGYGAGLYAHLDRMVLLCIAALLAGLMMLWSPLWLARCGRGPVERLWHRLQHIGIR